MMRGRDDGMSAGEGREGASYRGLFGGWGVLDWRGETLGRGLGGLCGCAVVRC